MSRNLRRPRRPKRPPGRAQEVLQEAGALQDEGAGLTLPPEPVHTEGRVAGEVAGLPTEDHKAPLGILSVLAAEGGAEAGAPAFTLPIDDEPDLAALPLPDVVVAAAPAEAVPQEEREAAPGPEANLDAPLIDAPGAEAGRAAALPVPPVARALPGPEDAPSAQAGTRPWRRLAYGTSALAMVVVGLLLARWVVAQTPRARDRAAGILQETTELWAGLSAAEKARNWPLCEQRAQQLLRLPDGPGNPHDKAQRHLEQAASEQRNLLVYDRFLQSVARQAPDAAVLTYAELSDDSVYRDLGAARLAEMREAFVRDHVLRAQAALERHGCRAAQPHIDAVLAVAPAAGADPQVQALSARCRPPGAMVGTAAEPRALAPGKLAPSKEPAPGPAKAPAPDPAETTLAAAWPAAEEPTPAAELPPAAAPEDPQRAPREGRPGPASSMDEAQQAYIGGDYKQAIRIAQRHTRTDGARAWRVIGGAACYLGDRPLVQRTLDHLDDTAQRFVRQICQRNGVLP